MLLLPSHADPTAHTSEAVKPDAAYSVELVVPAGTGTTTSLHVSPSKWRTGGDIQPSPTAHTSDGPVAVTPISPLKPAGVGASWMSHVPGRHVVGAASTGRMASKGKRRETAIS
jgi:hypothetical protein